MRSTSPLQFYGRLSYNKMEKIDIETILKYNIKRRSKGDYTKGGFYLITDINNKNLYVGKSKDVILRLKDHIYNAKNKKGLLIDRYISDNVYNYNFYIIDKYINYGIDFFSKNLDNVIEHKFIKDFNTYYPNGLNKTFYEQLRVK